MAVRLTGMAFPLSNDQQEAFKMYVSDDLLHRLKRDLHFVADNQKARDNLRNRSLIGLTIGAFIGGTFAYWFEAFLQRNEKSVQDPNKTITVTCLGAVLGGTSGVYLSACGAIGEMRQSQKYIQWRDEAIKTKIYPLFQQFLRDSDLLEDLLCDLTQDLISHPVKAPNGKVYEKAAIDDWLSRKAIELSPERLAGMSADASARPRKSFIFRLRQSLGVQRL
jgi:hypothetical protein